MQPLDDDNQGRPPRGAVGARARRARPRARAHGLGAVAKLDPPRTHFAAYLHALKWNCVTATDARLFQAPFRAGIKLMATSSRRSRRRSSCRAPTCSSPTTSASARPSRPGLVLQELLLRQQVDFARHRVPASVCLAVARRDGEALRPRFEIYNRAFVARRRRSAASGEPVATHNRFIISYQTLRRPEYRDPLLATGSASSARRKSLLILDEAHTAAPASARKYAIDSSITRVMRDSRRASRTACSSRPRRTTATRTASRRCSRCSTRSASAAACRPGRRARAGHGAPPQARSAAPMPSSSWAELLAEYTALTSPSGPRQARLHQPAKAPALEHRGLRAHARGARAHDEAHLGARHNGSCATPVDDSILFGSTTRTTTAPRWRKRNSRVLADGAVEAATGPPAPRGGCRAGRRRARPDRTMRKVAAALGLERPTHQSADDRVDRRAPVSRRKVERPPRAHLHRVRRHQALPRAAARAALRRDRPRRRAHHAPSTAAWATSGARRSSARSTRPAGAPVRILSPPTPRARASTSRPLRRPLPLRRAVEPGRMEQRNGRIDRKLQPQPEVRCHYFVYPQRPRTACCRRSCASAGEIDDSTGSIDGRKLADVAGACDCRRRGTRTIDKLRPGARSAMRPSGSGASARRCRWCSSLRSGCATTSCTCTSRIHSCSACCRASSRRGFRRRTSRV
jgi:hypothetical protein